MSAKKSAKSIISKLSITKFSGRASRRDCLIYLLLFAIVLGLLGSVIDLVLGKVGVTSENVYDLATAAIGFAFMLATLSLVVRRLHDIGYGGQWVLLYCIPGIGTIVLLILLILPGESKRNRFGPKPH